MIRVEPEPFDGFYRIFYVLMIVGVIAFWVLALATYYQLPEVIPTHFGLSGRPTSYGPSWTVFILPPAFSISPLIIMLIVRYRFKLVNEHPFLINLPAFYTYLPYIRPERRSFWVNRYFGLLLAFGTGLTYYLLALEYGICEALIIGKTPSWLLPVALGLPVMMIIVLMYYLFRLSKEMKKEALVSTSPSI